MHTRVPRTEFAKMLVRRIKLWAATVRVATQLQPLPKDNWPRRLWPSIAQFAAASRDRGQRRLAQRLKRTACERHKAIGVYVRRYVDSVRMRSHRLCSRSPGPGSIVWSPRLQRGQLQSPKLQGKYSSLTERPSRISHSRVIRHLAQRSRNSTAFTCFHLAVNALSRRQ